MANPDIQSKEVNMKRDIALHVTQYMYTKHLSVDIIAHDLYLLFYGVCVIVYC